MTKSQAGGEKTRQAWSFANSLERKMMGRMQTSKFVAGDFVGPDSLVRIRRLGERRVAHAETSAYVFGEQFDGSAIRYGISLCEVLHGLHEHFLTIDIAGIVGARALLARQIGGESNGENFCHSDSTFLGS